MGISRLLISLITALATIVLWVEPVLADLPPGNAITDANAILRYALPVQQRDLRDIQKKLEETTSRMPGDLWTNLNKTATASKNLLIRRTNQIVDSFPESKNKRGTILLKDLRQNLELLNEEATAKNKNGFAEQRMKCLQQIGDLQALFVEEFPYDIPTEYNDLPRLLGRATVEIKTTQGNLNAVIDGYNAPLTAGAFIDLALKGFYDGLPFSRAEDFYVLQNGDPNGPEIGYLDPETNQERHVPLEIRAPGESKPFYNETFEDLGLTRTTPVLPFSALGTLGWAHSDQALDDGSSQFFFFLFDAELTPAGRNLIDGRNAAFGYVVEGQELLKKLGVEDQILSIKVLNGAERLQQNG